MAMATNEPPKDPPDERPGDEPSALCDQTPQALAKFIAGTLGRAEGTRFRAHLTRCATCRDDYRQAVASAARFGRSVRERRGGLERERRHTGLRRRAIAATAEPRRKRRFGLRLALLPAGIALLILLWQSSGGAGRTVVQWEVGEVVAAGTPLGHERRELRLQPGDWCETLGGGEASIDARGAGGKVGIRLEEETQVQVLDTAGRRFRLQQGELLLDGPCRITTSQGVLEVESGEARLSLRGGRVDVDCLAGRSTWTGPAGKQSVAKGERIRRATVFTGAR